MATPDVMTTPHLPGYSINLPRQEVRTTFTSPGRCLGFALAVDSGGNVFVTGGNGGAPVVYKFTPGGVRSTFASVAGSLAIDSADNLFVADWGSGNILKFTPSGARTTFAARPVGAMAFGPPFRGCSNRILRTTCFTMRTRTKLPFGI